MTEKTIRAYEAKIGKQNTKGSLKSLSGWAELANCKGMEANDFFPDYTKSSESHGEREHALQICDNCVVKTECLEHAIKYEYFGIWGGTTQVERLRIRRRRRWKKAS